MATQRLSHHGWQVGSPVRLAVWRKAIGSLWKVRLRIHIRQREKLGVQICKGLRAKK